MKLGILILVIPYRRPTGRNYENWAAPASMQEMQWKIIHHWDLTLVRLPHIYKNRSSKCWCGHPKKGNFSFVWGKISTITNQKTECSSDLGLLNLFTRSNHKLKNYLILAVKIN